MWSLAAFLLAAQAPLSPDLQFAIQIEAWDSCVRIMAPRYARQHEAAAAVAEGAIAACEPDARELRDRVGVYLAARQAGGAEHVERFIARHREELRRRALAAVFLARDGWAATAAPARR